MGNPRTSSLVSLFPVAALLHALCPTSLAFQDLGEESILNVSLATILIDAPTDVEWADLDGDGDRDLLFVHSGDEQRATAWAENLGAGRFGGARFFGPRASTLSVVGAPRAVDIDLDGDLDVVTVTVPTSNQGARQNVGWVENLGAGRFASFVRLTPADALRINRGFDVYDIDADGDMDIVTGSSLAPWYENLGGLNFAPAVPLLNVPGGSGSIIGMDRGDLDGDGLVESYFAGASFGVIRVEADGAGGLTAPVVTITPPVSTFASDVVVADVDADGDEDLVVETRFSDASLSHTITLHENDGSGGLTPRVWSVNDEFHEGLILADMNGDGLQDVVRFDLVTDGALVSFQVPGSLTLGPPLSLATPFPSTRLGGVADVDGDGNADLWAATFRLDVAFGDGSGSFSPFELFASARPSRVPAAVGDMDGDGAVDLVTTDGLHLAVLRSGADGAYDELLDLAPAMLESPAARPALADVDGDGDLDVFVSTGLFPSFGAQLVFYENLGGTFGNRTTLATGFSDGAGRVMVGDGDGDGDLDVFWSYIRALDGNRKSGLWVMGDGAGQFTAAPEVNVGRDFRLEALHDVDGDGVADVLFTRGPGAGTLSWRPTGANGSLGMEASLVTVTGLSSQDLSPFALDDLDGDGDVDVVATSTSWTEVRVFEGLGGGAFAAPVPAITQAIGGSHAATLDLDGDGIRDVLSFGFSGGQFARGLGGLSFAPPVPIGRSALGLRDIDSVDLDGDGDEDLVMQAVGGIVLRRSDARFGTGFCPATPNTTGAPARLFGTGSRSVAVNDLTLNVESLPPGQFGIFIVSDTTSFTPALAGTPGVLCLDSQRIGRFVGQGQIQLSDAAGTVALDVDLALIPNGAGASAVPAGATRYFQYWSRDVGPGAANLSSALRVNFTR